MKKSNYSLEELFATGIQELYDAEKEYLNYFLKLSASASFDELNSSLSPERSEQASHVSRLETISIENKVNTESDSITAAIIKQLNKLAADKKKPSLIKDIQILKLLKQIYGAKIASYSSLNLIAENLQLEQAATLLEQSLEDSRNNMAYLIQIERNIIYPQFKS